MLRWCWLATLAACRFDLPVIPGGDGPIGPGMDTSPEGRSELCFGAFVEVCLAALPVLPLQVDAGTTRTIDTGVLSSDCVATVPDVDACVVAVTSITVNGTIRAVGSRPLVLLATSSIQIDVTAVVDVASRRGGPPGAGANAIRCVPGTTPTVETGGAGGSNAGRGGNGDQAGSGSTGGAASTPLPRPSALLGGCAGGNGAGGGGSGGNGGGVVDLIAPSILIDGTVNASGAGAGGATVGSGGGGGGGSGGLIVLDTPALTLFGTARVFAQGGGGSEGAENGVAGVSGAEPMQPDLAAPGGSGGSAGGGNGGNGATTDIGDVGGPDGTGSSGGGGGGGGAGFIITTDPTPPAPATSTVCPPFS